MKRAGVLPVVIMIVWCTACGGIGYGFIAPAGHGLMITSQNGYFGVRPGYTLQFSAVKIYPDGSHVTAKPRDYKWSSSNPAVGTVDGNGLFTAVDVGQTEIACIEKGDDRVQAYQFVTVDWLAP